jgi:hypothetical protein
MNTRPIPALLSILFVWIVITICISCSTSQQRTAFNTLYSLENTATAAVDSYDSLLIQGKVPTNSAPRVAKAYNDFQAAMVLAVDAVHFNSNAVAPPSLVVESQDLVNLITTVEKGATP